MASGSLLPSYAAAADFFGVGLLGSSSNAWGISGDGNVVVGHSQSEAFTWNEVDGIVSLGYLPGFDTAARAHAASYDGSVVVGYSTGVGSQKAFRWTSSGGMVDLGTLGGTFTRANGVSADGNVVVGISYTDAGNTVLEAFQWTQAGGIVGLGDLPGGDDYSVANAVSSDGTVVVGFSRSANSNFGEAFRWTQAEGMVGLGILPGASESVAQGISADGNVIVGRSGGQGFRWTQAGGMEALPFDEAFDVSSDGTVIVGKDRGFAPNGNVSDLAIRWTAAGGPQTVRAWLEDAGITINWTVLSIATGVSDDGCSVSGYGANDNIRFQQLEGFMARVDVAGGCNSGVTVPEITVTDEVPPVDDLDVAFGNITEMTLFENVVTVTNDGSADLILGNVAATDTLTAPFTISVDNCSGQSLSPSANCQIVVRFSPSSTGFFSDSFDIPSNDSDESSVTITVSGTGVATTVADITVTDSIAPIDDLQVPFGNVTQATQSDATITITNEGNIDLTVGNIASLNGLMQPFSILNDACSSQSLAPATSCTLTVRFEPTATGTFNDSFDIPSDDPDEASITVNLTGTGILAPVSDITVTDTIAPMDDLQIPFAALTVGGSSDQVVTVTNDGNDNLLLGDIAMANPLASPFSVVNDSCSTQIVTPAASCVFTVQFEPMAAGTFNDSLDIPSNDPDESTVTVSVSGTGLAAGVNNPPSTPQLVSPANGQQDLSTSVTLNWRPSTDPDGDTVTYDVYNCTDSDPLNNCVALGNVALLKSNPLGGVYYAGLGSGIILLGFAFTGATRSRKQTVLLVLFLAISSLLASCNNNDSSSSYISNKSFEVAGLAASTTYYWAVVANDGNGGVAPSEVWSYSTQ